MPSTAKLQGLYAIADAGLLSAQAMPKAVEAVLLGGGALIQYREKGQHGSAREMVARELKRLCQQYRRPLIINDDIELAVAIAADGVHLGRDDDSLDIARQALGPEAIIGVSCYNDLQRAERLATKADYLAFGAFYPSSSKPEAVLAEPKILAVAAKYRRPRVAIGGITTENAPILLAAGAEMLAVISGLFEAKDIVSRTRDFSALIKRPLPSSYPD